MKKGVFLFFALFSLIFFSVSIYTIAGAQQKAPEPTVIKLDSAKLPPVSFSHKTHVEKNKLECVACHHKDPKEPQQCSKCHLVAEVKDKAPIAKDAFHKQCQTCHKDSSAKGVKAPTACNECHKK
jgi:Class III cytochrome C family